MYIGMIVWAKIAVRMTAFPVSPFYRISLNFTMLCPVWNIKCTFQVSECNVRAIPVALATLLFKFEDVQK